MHLTNFCFGRYIPWSRMRGAVWGGKQRKIPRLTNSRKEAFLNHLLISQQNEQYLSNPCISKEVEAATLEQERALELKKEDEFFYNRYALQFQKHFPTRKVESFWESLLSGKRYDV